MTIWSRPFKIGKSSDFLWLFSWNKFFKTFLEVTTPTTKFCTRNNVKPTYYNNFTSKFGFCFPFYKISSQISQQVYQDLDLVLTNTCCYKKVSWVEGFKNIGKFKPLSFGSWFHVFKTFKKYKYIYLFRF